LVDPNRSFNHEKPGCEEARLAMACIRSQLGKSPALVHIDLHETTDTDNSEFIPARIARDGLKPEPWSEIPDGFYLIGRTPPSDYVPAGDAGCRAKGHTSRSRR